MAGGAVSTVMGRLRTRREDLGLTVAELNDTLGFGVGWVERFESGAYLPRLDIVLAIAAVLELTPDELFSSLATGADSVVRELESEEVPGGLHLHFPYGAHNATVLVPNATEAEYLAVTDVLRDGLSRLVTGAGPAPAVQTDSVAECFLKAVKTWPAANPSDLWWFLVYRAYMDRFNHPAVNAQLDLGQSWKRTGGWALEEVAVRHYGPHLAKHGVRMFIATKEQKEKLLGQLTVGDRLESDKADVLLCGVEGGKLRCFGVVHVKASFAERRTDDVPMSRTLVEAGYTSPLWTMDCKSTPSASPVNRGELGAVLMPGAKDGRSAKRKDIEDDGYFSACFSYNRNTAATPAAQKAVARVVPCDFTDPDDEFSRFVVSRWQEFQARGK